jgi:hypothetical protein
VDDYCRSLNGWSLQSTDNPLLSLSLSLTLTHSLQTHLSYIYLSLPHTHNLQTQSLYWEGIYGLLRLCDSQQNCKQKIYTRFTCLFLCPKSKSPKPLSP